MAEIQYIVLTIEKGTRKSFPNLISLATACGGFRSIPPYFAPLMLVKYAKSKSQFSTKVFEKKQVKFLPKILGKQGRLSKFFFCQRVLKISNILIVWDGKNYMRFGVKLNFISYRGLAKVNI